MSINSQQFGSFVPTTYVWDVGAFLQTDVNSPEFKELLVRLHEFVNLIAINTNLKDTGYYILDEFVNGQLYFPNPNTSTSESQLNRQVYRKIFNAGALPNAGVKSIPHFISCNDVTTLTRIYGTASNTTSLLYIPLPFSALVLADNIQLDVDSTNINIRTAVDYSAFDTTYIILEYLKQ